jgi:hypothetical protein
MWRRLFVLHHIWVLAVLEFHRGVCNMPKKRNQHVVPTGDGKWGVRGEGNERLTRVTNTQREAIDAARDIARNQGSEVVIHRPDGRIRDRDSYGNDPNPPKDRKH